MATIPVQGVAGLRAAARARHGCFTTVEARGHGVSDRQLQRMLRCGEIERVHLSVYRFAAAAWTVEARLAAAVLAGGSSACASHAGAAHLLGLRDVPRGRPEITVAGTRAPRLAGVRVHRSRWLPPGDVTTAAELPCTTGSRTLIDLAGRLSRPRLIALADQAISSGVASRPRLHDRATDLRSGRKGVGALVEVTEPGPDARFWSALERRFGRGVAAAGLPRPRYNAPVRWRGRTFFADALWEAARVVVELHGLRFHDLPADRGADAERANCFVLAGYRMLVFTWRDVFEDMEKVVAAVREALGGYAH